MPLPYPHRATFLASTLVVPLADAAATPYIARLLSLIVFDHFLRHPVVTLGDDDERFGDEQGRLLDANHPLIEDTVDWLFRIARRHEVLWFEISLDRTRPQATLLRARLPNGLNDEWTSSADLKLSQQIGQCLGQWLAARRLPLVASLPEFTVEDVRAAGDRLGKGAAMLSLRPDYTQIPPKLLHGSGFAVMNIINFLYGSAAFGFAALVPLYATQRFGIRTLESGTLLSARAIGIITASTVATMLLRRTGYRWPMAVGFSVTAGGLLAMAASPIGLSPYTWLALAAALTGLGMGVASPATNNASLQLAPEHVAAIAGLRGMFRQAGSITAVSVTTAILARRADPGLTQGHIFAVFAVVMLCTLPFMRLVPEHRGGW